MRLGVLHHPLNVVIRQSARCFDANLLLLVRRFVLGRHVQDTVGIDVEGHLHLRHAARCGWNPGELELPDRAIVSRQLTLALEHVYLDRGLVVVRCRESLALLRRNGRVPWDEHGRDAAEGLDAKRQWCDVEEENVLLLAREHRSLDGGADRDDLVRVHALVRLLLEEVLDDLLNLRHARLAADEDDLVDLLGPQAGILQRLLHRRNGALNQIVDQLFELRPAERVVQVLRPRLIGGDEGKVDIRRHRARQLHLRLLGGFLQPLERHRVLREVDSLIALDLANDPVDHALIEVVAA